MLANSLLGVYMKNLFKILAIVLVMVFSLSVFVACDVLKDIGDIIGGNGDVGTGDGGGSGDGGSGSGSGTYTLDVYAINDMHGKFTDTDAQPGVDEMTTYLRKVQNEQNALLLSSGDMWQGSCESGLTKGNIITDWMNELGFSAMTLGNHEFDWGEEPVKANAEIAEFPLLAINVYDEATNQRVDYCEPSVLIDKGEVQIGIIGAIGDCYSSISADQVEGIYFKTDAELTDLVKAESQKLKTQGADFIIYSLHDGYGRSYSSDKYLVADQFSNEEGVYYDTELSKGYVDLVFEAHSHQSYVIKDEYGVYHLQGGGDNTKGMTHAQVVFNLDNDTVRVNTAEILRHSVYSNLAEDEIVEKLLEKYDDLVGDMYLTIGVNRTTIGSTQIKNLVARLYYEAGVEEWGDTYDIVLGGGYLSVRSPYDLNSGAVNYSMLYMLLPFDNEVVLCSIKGSDLINRYFENGSYFIYVGDYGNTVRNNIVDTATYYIITDTYNLVYKANKLTFVASLGPVYARDLVADYVAEANSIAFLINLQRSLFALCGSRFGTSRSHNT